MNSIFYFTKPAEEMRYDTVGDWQESGGMLIVTVAHQGDWRSNFLVAIHEMIEAALCQHRGIEEERVTKFDIEYDGDGEPGDQINAPYRREHQFAEAIERLLANELGVNWTTYNGDK